MTESRLTIIENSAARIGVTAPDGLELCREVRRCWRLLGRDAEPDAKEPPDDESKNCPTHSVTL